MMERLAPDTIAHLLRMLAHDLRNPLSALHSNCAFLGSAPEPRSEEEREAIADALVSCDSLQSLVDGLDLLSRALRETGVEPGEPVRIYEVRLYGPG